MFSEKRGNVLHGVLLIALFSCSAFYIAEFQFIKQLSFSPLIVGIILGMLYANSLRNHLPETWVPGILFCTKQVLRAGIVLYGFKLTFQSVIAIGLPAILIDMVIVVLTILIGVWVGRLMKMDKDLALLTATGSAICGAAAVLGAEPVVKCEAHKTAVAVSTVVIFGTLSMFIYPVMYRAGILDLDPEQMGLYTGATLHEVAHVLVVMSFMLARTAVKSVVNGGRNGGGVAPSRGKITIPWFAFGFLAVIGFNSLDLLPHAVVDGINQVDTFMLTMAMTALGTETSIEKFKKAGAKPFVLAAILYVWLLAGGYVLAKYVPQLA